jgi:two-component system response regulator AtoC
VSEDEFDDQATQRRSTPEQPAPLVRYRLIVSGDASVRTLDLPTEGSVTVGRVAGCDLVLNDNAVSRRHAAVHVSGDRVWVEDLGSANGTTLNGAPLPTNSHTHFRPGDAVSIDSWLLLLQPAPSPTLQRPTWQHGFFESRLVDELRRSLRNREPLALVRVSLGERLAEDAAIRAIEPLLGADDVIGTYAPNELEIMILGELARRPEVLVDRLLAALRALDESTTAAFACAPQDGTTAESLLGQACARLRVTSRVEATGHELVLRSPVMVNLDRMIDRVSKSSISVMIQGETGVGKEVIAELIHQRSPRSKAPFIRVNCAALSETLLESELFGYEKGAFTGAVKEKRGLIEAAHGGTLFLDEIGDVSLAAQVKLLRVLEERRVTRVGGLESKAVDIRIVSATHRDVEAMITREEFRQDLYFRLAAIVLTVPPLRERQSEIESLARGFVAMIARRDGVAAPRISAAVFTALSEYSWPGNVRELRNVMERAVVLASDVVELEHLPMERMQALRRSAAVTPAAGRAHPLASPVPGSALVEEDTGRISNSSLQGELRALEERRIVDALARCSGNQTEAAKLLGMSRRTLVSKLDLLGVARPRKPVRGGGE